MAGGRNEHTPVLSQEQREDSKAHESHHQPGQATPEAQASISDGSAEELDSASCSDEMRVGMALTSQLSLRINTIQCKRVMRAA